MLKASQLDQRRLTQIVSDIVDALYLDDETGKYDRDKEWDTGDTLQVVADTLGFYNLVPDWGHDDEPIIPEYKEPTCDKKHTFGEPCNERGKKGDV